MRALLHQLKQYTHLGGATDTGTYPRGMVWAEQAIEEINCRRFKFTLVDSNLGVRRHALVHLP